MRGYPDNNTTGIHLAKPRYPQTDRCRQQCDEKDDVVESVTVPHLFFFITLFFYSVITFIAKQIYFLTDKVALLQLTILSSPVCLCVCLWKNAHANKVSTKQPFFFNHLVKDTQHFLQFVAI